MERLEKEMDSPARRVEGRMLMRRSARTEAELWAGLEAFVNYVSIERRDGEMRSSRDSRLPSLRQTSEDGSLP